MISDWSCPESDYLAYGYRLYRDDRIAPVRFWYRRRSAPFLVANFGAVKDLDCAVLGVLGRAIHRWTWLTNSLSS